MFKYLIKNVEALVGFQLVQMVLMMIIFFPTESASGATARPRNGSGPTSTAGEPYSQRNCTSWAKTTEKHSIVAVCSNLWTQETPR